MVNITGQSIAAASDSVSKNGKKNTIIGWGLVISAPLIIVGVKFAIKHYYRKNENKNKHDLDIAKENNKHKNKIKEIELKHELKKDLIDYRDSKHKESSSFNLSPSVDNMDTDAEVDSYDDLVAGEDISVEDQRLGLRSFHIGMDCGLIGRTQAGKTSMGLHYAIALVGGYPNAGRMLTPDWHLSQSVKVLYFAFEQNRAYFKTKYGKFVKSIPNLSVETKIGAGDFMAIQKKIVKMQNEVGNRRLVVFLDNITKMKGAQAEDKKDFFQWLEDYRVKCDAEGKPITYIKIFHTQGSYKDYMPIECTSNYGSKSDTYFTQDLVGFGVCKGGNGKMRYIKELKNKMEPGGEKPELLIFRFADTPIPLFEYEGEADECDVLPSRAEMVRGVSGENNETGTERLPVKRGRKEDYSEAELNEMYEEHTAGFPWREILEVRNIPFSKNKKRTIQEALKRHGFKLGTFDK